MKEASQKIPQIICWNSYAKPKIDKSTDIIMIPRSEVGVPGSNYWIISSRCLFEVMKCSNIEVMIMPLYGYIKSH